MISHAYKSNRVAFTLIEVVLALGVFFISILALIGLLAPMLRSVDEIEKIDEISSVVNTVNAFLQSSPEIGDLNADPPVTKFNAIYKAVSNTGGNEATIFVYRFYDSDNMIRLEIGFSEDEDGIVGPNSIINQTTNSIVPSFNNAAGPIYRIVLTASSVTPLLPEPALRSADRDPTTGIYTLTQDDVANYTEGYLALEARIFAEDPPGPAPAAFDALTVLSDLNKREPDFTFNTAIVR